MMYPDLLLDPEDRLSREALDFPVSEYGARFVDVDFWRPYVELIASTHVVPVGEITMGEPGTFPTFILNRAHVVKLFGQSFDGVWCWEVERDVDRILAEARLSIPFPAIVAAGVLSRAPDWTYIVTPFVAGEPYAVARDGLSQAARIDVAGALGRMLRVLHDLAVPAGTSLGDGWAGWASFIAGQRRGVTERHRAWDVLPARLVDEIDGYVAGYRVPYGRAPSLVHADLHDHHLIGMDDGVGGWKIGGVIDWGDAWSGDRFYELPALHLGSFHGDRAMLRAFLEAYGWEDHRSDAFVRRAMTMTLLHEFNVLERVGSTVDLRRVASLDALAETLWRV